jgi:hypothetical protein
MRHDLLWRRRVHTVATLWQSRRDTTSVQKANASRLPTSRRRGLCCLSHVIDHASRRNDDHNIPGSWGLRALPAGRPVHRDGRRGVRGFHGWLLHRRCMPRSGVRERRSGYAAPSVQPRKGLWRRRHRRVRRLWLRLGWATTRKWLPDAATATGGSRRWVAGLPSRPRRHRVGADRDHGHPERRQSFLGSARCENRAAPNVPPTRASPRIRSCDIRAG